MADDAVTNAAGEEILGGRALNYRKVTIAVCVVLWGMYLFTSINFSGLNVFGLRIEGDPRHQRTTVLLIVWMFLVYHAGFFGYYALRDARFWVHKLTRRPRDASNPYPYLPEVRMYFGWSPTITKPFKDAEGGGWKRSVNRDGVVVWSPVKPEGVDGRNPLYAMAQYAVPEKLVRLVNEKVWWFFLVDVGVPALFIIGAVVLAFARG